MINCRNDREIPCWRIAKCLRRLAAGIQRRDASATLAMLFASPQKNFRLVPLGYAGLQPADSGLDDPHHKWRVTNPPS